MNVQLACSAVFNCQGEAFWLQARTAANPALLARHERADAVSREFALGLLVKPLHLRHQSFERPLLFASCSRFIGVAGETHFDRRAVRSEIERAPKWLGQVLEWQ